MSTVDSMATVLSRASRSRATSRRSICSVMAWRGRNLRPAITRSPPSVRKSISLVASFASCAARKACMSGGLTWVLRFISAIDRSPRKCSVETASFFAVLCAVRNCASHAPLKIAYLCANSKLKMPASSPVALCCLQSTLLRSAGTTIRRFREFRESWSPLPPHATFSTLTSLRVIIRNSTCRTRRHSFGT